MPLTHLVHIQTHKEELRESRLLSVFPYSFLYLSFTINGNLPAECFGVPCTVTGNKLAILHYNVLRFIYYRSSNVQFFYAMCMYAHACVNMNMLYILFMFGLPRAIISSPSLAAMTPVGSDTPSSIQTGHGTHR